MVVVAITGTLAAVALPAFTGYIMRSRVAEAAAFLGIVKLRQTSYRGEFGQYAANRADVAGIVFVPGPATMMRDAGKFPFPPAPPVLGPEEQSPFYAIGAIPDGAVRFGYGIVAGNPLQASAGGGGTNLAGAPYNLPATELDYYFIAQATSDLDDDGQAMVIETSSFARDLWFSDVDDGWD